LETYRNLIGQDQQDAQGPSSKAAASKDPKAYPHGYVEGLIECENAAGAAIFQHPAL